MDKFNIVQFLPYFPPHLGGLETHAQEWGKWRVKKGYGEVVNVVFDVGQKKYIENLCGKLKIFDAKGLVIGYKQDGVLIYLIPSFDLIPNFPFPKFWKKQFWTILKLAKEFKPNFVITRTRFFLSAFLGGVFAKLYKIKWVHIEHGSGFLKLSNLFKTLVGGVYDKTIGKWIFRKSDILIPISKACQRFISEYFTLRKTEVIYRGIDFVNREIDKKVENFKETFPDRIIVGYVGRIYKWKNVGNLILAYYGLSVKDRQKFQIVIVGGGEDLNNLKIFDKDNLIYFLGDQDFDNALAYQKQFDINFHTSAPGGGISSVLLQALWLGPFIIATPYEGANEVIKDGYNGILLDDSSVEQMKKGLLNYLDFKDKKIEYAKINRQIIEKDFVWEKSIEKYYLKFSSNLGKNGK